MILGKSDIQIQKKKKSDPYHSWKLTQNGLKI